METFVRAVEWLRLLLVHVPGLAPLAAAPYLFRPLLMVLALGAAGAVVGVLVNLRCAEFHAEALVHAVFPGIVVGAVYRGIEAIIPAAAVAGVAAAAVLTSFFSIGLIILLAKGDMSGQLEALMFGRLLEITDLRLAQALAVSAVSLLLVMATWKEQVAHAFDATSARASGLRPVALDLVLNAAVAGVVVSASTAVGTLLVIGYLVIPGATGRILAGRVRTMVAISLATGVGGGYIGLLVMIAPLPRPVSPQACVVLVMAAVLLAAAAVRSHRKGAGA